MDHTQAVAIVTGGASGIGRAIGRRLARDGVFIVIADLNVREGLEAEQELNRLQGKARFVQTDVTVKEQVEAVVAGTHREFGRLDYMFNNAGIALYGELYHMTPSHWQSAMDVNVWGIVYGTQAAYALMKEQGFGYIANTASAAGLGPSPMAAVYATTKHAVVGLTTSLHYEAEPFGVHVTALCPAFVDTPIFDKGEAVRLDKGAMLAQMKKQKMLSPDRFAEIALAGLKRNEPIVCPMPLRRTMDIVFLLFPSLHRKLMRLVCKVSRKAAVQ